MIEHVSSRPAQHRNAILLCADQKFLAYGALSIARIRHLMPDLDADICLASTASLDLPDILASLDVRRVILEISEDTKYFPISDIFPIETYLRCFATQALASDYDRILYLDCDVIADQPDLMDVFSLEMVGNTPLAAVRDVAQLKDPLAPMPEMETLGIPVFPYLNSGVLLIDTKRWLEQDVFGRVMQTIRDAPHALHYFDQSALNLTLKGSWTEMSHHWNWMTQTKMAGYLRWDKPSLIHFIGPEKPWLAITFWLPQRWRTFYDQNLLTHFQIAPPDRNAPGLRRKSKASIFWGNLRNLRHILRRNRRFATPLKTRDPNT